MGCDLGIFDNIVSDCSTIGNGGNERNAWILNRKDFKFVYDSTYTSRIIDIIPSEDGNVIYELTTVFKALDSGYDSELTVSNLIKYTHYVNLKDYNVKAAASLNIDNLNDVVIIVESRDDDNAPFRVYGARYGLYVTRDTRRANQDLNVRDIDLTSRNEEHEPHSSYELLQTDYATTKAMITSAVDGEYYGRDIFVIFDGQSNNGGKGYIDELPSDMVGLIADNVSIWYSNSIQPINVGVNHNGQMVDSYAQTFPVTQHAAEVQIAYSLSKQYPNRNIYFVKTGRGGTPLYNINARKCFSEKYADSYHKDLIDNVSDFLTSAGRDINSFEAWYVWDQGESDAVDVYAQAYEQNLKDKLDAVRADLEADNLYILARIMSVTHQYTMNISYLKMVQDAEIKVLSEYKNAHYVYSDSYDWLSDNLHLSSLGQRQKGEDMFRIMRDKFL